MDLKGNWNYPTTVRFGAGRIGELGEAVKAVGMRNPLFVTDPVLAKMPMTQGAASQLSAKVFSDIKPNPVEANVTAGVAAFKAGGHDGVVAFGGGSALDVGKLVAFMAGQSRRSGISRTSATGGPAPMLPLSRRSSRCRPPPAPARRLAAPLSSPTRKRTPRKSSFIRR